MTMNEETTLKARLAMAALLFELARIAPSELSEKLLTSSTAVLVLQEGLIEYAQRVKSQIVALTDPALLEPKVTASCSIDGTEREAVDVTRWFAQSDDFDLLCLREETYGGGSTSEDIVAFMAFFDSDIESWYFLTSDPAVTCQVNQKEAEAWILAHRPQVLLEESDE